MKAKKKVTPAKRKKPIVKVPKCLERTKKHKYTDDEVEEMKIVLFDAITDSYLDCGDGFDEYGDNDWATDQAREEVEGMTKNQIINMFERDFKE